MSGKMKAIIGGSISLVIILILVLVLTSGGSITPQEFAKESVDLGQNALTKLETAQNKDDLKAIYKETLPQFLDMIPGALVGAKQYVETKGGYKKMAAEFDTDWRKATASYTKDFEDVIGPATSFQTKLMALERNEGFSDRMEKIFDTVTDLDVAEIVTFTMAEYKDLIKDIASNDDAVQALNWYIAIATPEYSYDWEEGKKVWVEYEDGYGGYWDWTEGKRTKTPITPIVITKEKLLSLSAIIENAFMNVNTLNGLEDAAEKIEEEFEKEFGFRMYRLF